MATDLSITQSKLLQLNKFLKEDKAAVWAKALDNARQIANLNTPRRVRQFLAQVADETAGFKALTESFFWVDPRRLDDTFREINGIADAQALIAKGPDAIANRVYANRMGNGDEASGDGSRYKGRGFIQLTGKDNYRLACTWAGMDLLENPGLAGQPTSAGVIAGRYWNAHHLNDLADQGDLSGITEAINGGLNGFENRKTWLLRMQKIFPDN